MSRFPNQCPSCADQLRVHRLSCSTCGTVVEGDYGSCRFCRAELEQLELLELFLACRGNVREVQRTLGISYPTTRNRLEEMFLALGFGPREGPAKARMEILRELDGGRISVEEAEEQLRGTGSE